MAFGENFKCGFSEERRIYGDSTIAHTTNSDLNTVSKMGVSFHRYWKFHEKFLNNPVRTEK